ncbi:RNA polymerase sigma factor [Pseudothauera rhizosphaerae]|uniref:RNA polymerase sigma factor n=1 Tax=Pseudothauera rhizosphaerae TaxID=2565932 RepID=A0A4S4AXT3_9RHOO|nr:RNA polymerase sigma factor [Pseudothauera rhizosphaerae]THF64128.1 RNA polymerase sigma factor [Pseudothauera rhizosphaerae]
MNAGTTTDDEARMLASIPRLRRYARALAGNAVAADDLVQDTLARAWPRLSSCRGNGELLPWLFTIMHNLHADQVRRPRLLTVPIEEEAAAVPVRPRQHDNLELRDLEAALLKLPEDYRKVLLLVALENMPYAQAAEVLGWPAGTVMSRLSRARARLRVLLSEESPPVLKVAT